jgi:hypothetical protein
MIRECNRVFRLLRVGLALLALPAGATSLLYRDVPALTRASDAIVVGRVVKTESRWTSDHRRIVTDVTLEVSESLKGAPGSTVVVRQAGGQIGEIGQRVDGMASFARGEEVLVFLTQRPDQSFLLSGMAQGKYRVEHATNGKVLAHPESPGTARFIDPQTQAEIEVKPQTLELPTLKSQIRTSLAKPQPRDVR